MDAGLLILRLVAGIVMAGHGAQKLFGWFGGYGLTGTGGFFEQLGFRPGRVFAAAAAAGETAGGVLLALGLLGPVGPATVLAVMIVAAVSVHWANGLFVGTNGIEVPLLYAAIASALALTGHGSYSLDAWLGLTPLWTAPLTWAVLVLAIVASSISLALRRPQLAAS